ncbi:MAG: GtrA family protein [Lachnospiraceae bacterium]|nr:GtrA family protein [Lachnospiraceae bacterium]
MNKLLQQILKFGAVGGVCFLIDFGVTMGLKLIGVHYLLAGLCGFLVSVVANYILSFKFVFQRKEDMDRKKEFVIFVVLSAGGLLINELILYLCIDLVYASWNWLNQLINENLATAAAKIAATGVVMVYNFVTRKMFLEKKEEPGAEKDQ